MIRAQTLEAMRRLIKVAKGEEDAELVILNATYLNVFTESWERGDIALCGGLIAGIGHYRGKRQIDASRLRVVPGFIDGHIHLESSLLAPHLFAQCVLPHGTTAVCCDPHEIANVMGVDGIAYMLKATEGLPLDAFVMLPSCVPATEEDESFAALTAADLEPFYTHPRVRGLAEMMNYPGVLSGSEGVLQKLLAAQKRGVPIDGHAPGLSGRELQAYIASGIQSDHECSTAQEALAKLSNGQWIMLREGTAAQNLRALLPLMRRPYAARCLFVTDDKHPAELERDGHIDGMVRMAVSEGVDPVLALKAASWNAAQAFSLERRGAVAPGYAADLALIDESYQVQMTLKDGRLVYTGEPVDIPAPPVEDELYQRATHTFHMPPVTAGQFAISAPAGVVRMVGGQILTENGGMANGVDLSEDRVKLAVLERHHQTGHVGVGYLTGYGLKRGAIATSIAHDSHNLIVAGVTDEDMACAAERVRQLEGGMVLALEGKVIGELPLPIAGLMTSQSAEMVDAALCRLKDEATRMGIAQNVDPFMTLSFMSLPVIPAARVLTHGVFDTLKWRYISRS